jgi:hypothetical protein
MRLSYSEFGPLKWPGVPQGLKPLADVGFLARLKPCPFEVEAMPFKAESMFFETEAVHFRD